MKLNLSKEWLTKRAEQEEKAEVSAGVFSIDMLKPAEVEFVILAARCGLCTRGWVGCRWQDLDSFLPIHKEHPEHITYSVRIVGTSQVFDLEIVP